MKTSDINMLSEEAEAVIFKLKNNAITKKEALISFEKIIKKVVEFLGEENEYVKDLQRKFKRILFMKEKHKEFKEHLRQLEEKEAALFKELGINL